MPAKQQRGAATVDRVLAAALQVFAEPGRHGFTVSAVAEAADVSLGSIYHHFGSFDGLAAHLYDRCLDHLCDALIAELSQARTARAGIHALVSAYLRFTADHRDEALFLHGSAHSGRLAAQAAEIRAFKAERLTAVADRLRPHLDAGTVERLPAPVLDVLVLGPVEEAARRWLSGAYDLDLDAAAQLLPDRIWRSLRPD
ncbi:TetR/AcrR family transcriptional regulator [Streptomyces cavernicola]|uniref:TetR/AcrR family transcriptional regulator n=1 Tax=Streptomyces cavernicola TaxID=3043613 RepID=A0ABT6S6T9_9ACTN|nr:TetR/AcrR family transcriptional regulator [Streptomyces sp. B-S-A6]MDI3403816.1 TetR/AcrR family transcriptional regulator [Streptomyces sp. B-S-A6]